MAKASLSKPVGWPSSVVVPGELMYMSTWGDNQPTLAAGVRGWYAYPVRTVRGALGANRPAPPVRTLRRPRGVRVSIHEHRLLLRLVLQVEELANDQLGHLVRRAAGVKARPASALHLSGGVTTGIIDHEAIAMRPGRHRATTLSPWATWAAILTLRKPILALLTLILELLERILVPLDAGLDAAGLHFEGPGTPQGDIFWVAILPKIHKSCKNLSFLVLFQ